MVFYSLMDQVKAAASIQEKLHLCEQDRGALAAFSAYCIQEDGELPPSVLCRDYAPIWYMRLGQWHQAEDYIRFCISCGAYLPGDGSYELQYLKMYRQAATKALAFISCNPGFLQNKLYKALGDSADKNCLKDFTRFSHLLIKEPHGKTNKLYVAGTPQ